LGHIEGSLFEVDTESVNSRKAAPELGYNASAFQTSRVISLTAVAVTMVESQDPEATTFKMKLEGETREVLVYATPSTVTAET